MIIRWRFVKRSSKGVLLFDKREGILFIKYAAVSTHSPQKGIGKLD